jgi:hypothetical protein
LRDRVVVRARAVGDWMSEFASSRAGKVALESDHGGIAILRTAQPDAFPMPLAEQGR